MATHFSNSTGNAASYRKLKFFADNLANFIINSSPALLDFVDLLYPREGLQDCKNIINLSITSNSSDPPASNFFNELLKINVSMRTDRQWWEFLGEVVECTIYKLLLEKYSRAVLQEKVAQVRDRGVVVADMAGKSMDLIVWDTIYDHGEMHEVKKALESKARHRSDPKFSQKLTIISNFKSDLVNHGRKDSFLGVATLLETTADARIMVRIIAPAARIDVLGRDSLRAWMGQNYL